jgi:arabinofuranosyltransferase
MHKRQLIGWLLLAAVIGVLAIHARYYFPFFSDDALISLRYSKRLCGGHGLTWTDGERVEGYTDLLWVLLNAPAACVHADPIWSARVLDFLGSALAIGVVGLSPSDGRKPHPPRLLTGGMMLALSAPVAVWAIGGLEHGFMLGILTAALWFARRSDGSDEARNARRGSFLFGLLVLLRADGVVLFACATVGRWLCREGRAGGLRALIGWLSFPVAFLGLQLAFRWGYYGEVIPNTVVAKVSFSAFRLQQGLSHVRQGFLPLAVLGGAAFVAIAYCLENAPRLRLVVPVFVAAGWSAYLAVVGGDIFPGWRQLLFVTAPLALLVADGAEQVMLGASGWRGPLLSVVWFVAVTAHVNLQFSDAENRRAKNELWEWDGLPVGLALKRAFGEKKPVLAVDAAGALPYWSELPALDMLGLNDRYIPRHPPQGFGRGVIGHELGDPAYVWRRSPDLIAFCGSRGNVEPCFVSGKGIFARPDFSSTYQHVLFRVDDGRVTADLYVKREGGRLGVTRNDHVITIPGYLFTDGPAVASLDAPGNGATAVLPGAPARTTGYLHVPPGTWTLATDPPAPRLLVAFACDGVSPSGNSASFTLRLAAPVTLDISVGLPDGDAGSLLLRSATLTEGGTAKPSVTCDSATASSPVDRNLAQVDRQPVAGADWARPEAVRFGSAGLRVTFSGVRHLTRFTISADGNDRYVVRFLRNGISVDQSEVPRRGVGLREIEVKVPSVVTAGGADAALITPGEGDGAYSVDSFRVYE